LTPAAPVLCAAPDALAVLATLLLVVLDVAARDGLNGADAEKELDCPSSVDFEVECVDVICVDGETAPDPDPNTPDETLDRMKVGVCVNVGTSFVSVGITRELGPKKGALEGSKRGPLAV
jgi:hypothetical protein